jgi:hypothetical protein
MGFKIEKRQSQAIVVIVDDNGIASFNSSDIAGTNPGICFFSDIVTMDKNDVLSQVSQCSQYPLIGRYVTVRSQRHETPADDKDSFKYLILCDIQIFGTDPSQVTPPSNHSTSNEYSSFVCLLLTTAIILCLTSGTFLTS